MNRISDTNSKKRIDSRLKRVENKLKKKFGSYSLKSDYITRKESFWNKEGADLAGLILTVCDLHGALSGSHRRRRKSASSIQAIYSEDFRTSQTAWMAPGTQPRIVRIRLMQKSPPHPLRMRTAMGGRRMARTIINRSDASILAFDGDVDFSGRNN